MRTGRGAASRELTTRPGPQLSLERPDSHEAPRRLSEFPDGAAVLGKRLQSTGATHAATSRAPGHRPRRGRPAQAGAGPAPALPGPGCAADCGCEQRPGAVSPAPPLPGLAGGPFPTAPAARPLRVRERREPGEAARVLRGRPRPPASPPACSQWTGPETEGSTHREAGHARRARGRRPPAGTATPCTQSQAPAPDRTGHDVPTHARLGGPA